MNEQFDRNSILQGNRLRRENTEQPVTFAQYNGAVEPIPDRNLDSYSQRMAGTMGSRALTLMNDPAEAMRTQKWMSLFDQSNEGFAFNQAKMMEAQDPAILKEEGAQS